ncbi:MAG: glycolate oxidase subunit GlcF [Hyphomicrobiaceae bacterium]|nr:glycolate oxidase subunit GlcF [Hyphomicrobiaceae bacterium]
MQTTFTPAQLADPRNEEANRILRRCVHCGLCTAVCSTYVVLGDERDSPRGRIYLIKDMLEGGKDASTQVQHHIDRCLSCLSCMTTCPGGVDYMHLVDIARAHINETGKRPLKERVVRELLARIVPYPDRFRLALKAAPLGRPLVPFLKRIGMKELAAMVELAPEAIPPAARYEGPGTAATGTVRRARVILMAGCAQQVLRPDINDATIRLLARRGVDVVVANGAGCCGALVHHMGREKDAHAQAKANVDAWVHEIDKSPVDAIIINASGCGTTVKDYAHMLRHDPAYADKARRVVALTKDITEFLSDYHLGPPRRYSSLRVAYHSACSMQHGQRITDEPKELLKRAGYTVADVPEGHICCGSAGVYNILQPEIAGQLKERKIGNIRKAKPDLVATGNIGCIAHLEKGLGVPIAHTVELIDWAFGGPVPRGLEKLAAFVSDVPEPKRYVEDDFLYPIHAKG